MTDDYTLYYQLVIDDTPLTVYTCNHCGTTITHINNHDALTIHTNWHHQIDGTPSPWAT